MYLSSSMLAVSSYENSLPMNDPDLFEELMRLTLFRAGRYSH